MSNPVVHFEIIGKDPQRLRDYYSELFGWDTNTDVPVAPQVSEPGNYGFIESTPSDRTTSSIPGGIGGGANFDPHTIFYVGVDDVSKTLERAEQLGGKKIMDPSQRPGGGLVIAQFKDPEGNVIGLAGPQ